MTDGLTIPGSNSSMKPTAIETRFRALTRLRQQETKDWADSYLAAFATVGQLTLVTFDRGLRSRAKSVILLGE
jgi:predicted nucleic acid-binding protein